MSVRSRRPGTPEPRKTGPRSRNGPRRGSARPSAKRSPGPLTEEERVTLAVNRYILRQYPLGVLAGTPRRLSLQKSDVWVVPVILTSPGYGAVGEVGVVAVNAQTGAIVGSTPKEDVIAAGKRLREEERDDLETAFRRARTV